jgi:drug/metabolite transporter (DMT)-like permease
VNTRAKAHTAVLGTNIFFAANYSMVKLISPVPVGPFAVNLLRVGLSLGLFWLVWLFGKTPAGIRKKDWGRFFLCALSGVAINQLLFIKGLTMTSTVHASLLILATPLLVTVFALWVLKEQFTLYKASGLALGIGGSVFLILQKESSPHAPDYLLGDLFILINATSYAIYFILVKPLMKDYSALHVIRWVFTLGFLMIIPFGWQETAAIEWSSLQWMHIGAMASIAVTGTFLAYYFNAYGIRHLGAGTTGSYIYTQPVFAVIIATVVLHESLDWRKVLAAILIFSGVYLANYRRNPRSTDESLRRESSIVNRE